MQPLGCQPGDLLKHIAIAISERNKEKGPANRNVAGPFSWVITLGNVGGLTRFNMNMYVINAMRFF